jgi:hypothetical protein
MQKADSNTHGSELVLKPTKGCIQKAATDWLPKKSFGFFITAKNAVKKFGQKKSESGHSI